MSLRELGPSIGRLRTRHRLDSLGMEGSQQRSISEHIHLSASFPKLEAALEAEALTATVG